MESLGEYLRQVRKQKGLGIDQIAEKTRINPVYIRALEDEHFDQFPGETFAKGFVRSYARSLGLDEKEILKRFKEASAHFYSKSTEDEREVAVNAEKESRDNIRISRFFQAGILLLIGTSVWFVYGLNSPRVSSFPVSEPPAQFDGMEESLDSGQAETETGLSNNSGNQPSDMENTESMEKFVPGSGAAREELPGGVNPEKLQRQVEEIAPSVNLPEGMFAPLENPDPLILKIEAVEDTWILAHIDDFETKEVFLRVGETVTWKANERFLVDFGNAGGVNISLDGKFLPSLGESGQVVKGVLLERE